MPEAYAEAEEVKSEVERLRPEWLRSPPDTVLFKRLRHDWIRSRGGQWDRIHADASMLRRHDEAFLSRARDDAEAARKASLDWPSGWREVPLTSMMARLSHATAGWDGGDVEPWRLSGMKSLETVSSIAEHATVQWLAGEVDLEVMHLQSASLVKFWLHEVDLQRMRRHWLRWAFEHLQRQFKVTPGTPADAQLGTYLIDVDLLLSADRGLIRIAEKCHREAPFNVAAAQLVPAGAAAAEAVIAAIGSRKPS